MLAENHEGSVMIFSQKIQNASFYVSFFANDLCLILLCLTI